MDLVDKRCSLQILSARIQPMRDGEGDTEQFVDILDKLDKILFSYATFSR